MAQKKGKKYTRTPPPDEKRCIAKTAAGGRCRRKREKDSLYCSLGKDHKNGKAREWGKKGAAVTSERRRKLQRLAAGWDIGKDWESFIGYAESKIAELEEGLILTDAGKSVSPLTRDRAISQWMHHIIRAMDARAKHSAGGTSVILMVVKGEDDDLKIPPPVEPRPKPTDVKIDGSHEFNPREDEG